MQIMFNEVSQDETYYKWYTTLSLLFYFIKKKKKVEGKEAGFTRVIYNQLKGYNSQMLNTVLMGTQPARSCPRLWTAFYTWRISSVMRPASPGEMPELAAQDSL